MMMNRAKVFMTKLIEDQASLPEDMLIEILIYLPIRSLVRFKCISKYWNALINSPTFLTRHLKRDCKKILLVKRYLPPHNSDDNVYKPGGDDILSFHDPNSLESLVMPSLHVPFLNDVYARFQVILMGPCIGLVCLMSHDVIVLCNPALREFKLLEPSPFTCPEDYMVTNEGSGFGFDSSHNSYKIIQMWCVSELYADYYFHDEYIRIDLYNSSTNSWKIIDVKVPQVRYDPGFELLFNGAWHWQANEFIDGPHAMGFILSFDFSTEVFQKFEFPDWFNDDKRPGLVVLNECLALVRYSGWIKEPHLIDIWIMKEYGVKESWTKQLIIGPYHFKCPLLCWRNEWLVVESSENHLASCALNTNEIKRFQFDGFERSFRALIFTESIISLN